jgi:C1A family cysteine protease
MIAIPGLAGDPAPQIVPPFPRQWVEDLAFRGFVPVPVDLSHINAPMAGPMPISPRLDWRESGKVTSVKNQSTCGSCYAFASLANIESKLLIDGAGSFNFSENNVKECEYYGSSCAGGNYWLVASFLSASGTVLETCDPYVPADVACNSGCPYLKTLTDWNVISGDVVPSVNVLKSYIQTYGPVYTTMYAGDDDTWETDFQTYNGSYTLYYTGTEEPNHAVLIIGWDDDLPHAGGTGAWIVKNSWGTGWGGTCGYGAEGGYCTIAYGSASIGKSSSFIGALQDYDSDGELMLWDEGGIASAVGYGNTTAWGLCKFVAGADIELRSVEFWAADMTTDVDCYVYDDFNGSIVSNLLASKLNSSFGLAGYHSVELDAPLELDSGEDFYVVVKITCDSYTYPIVFDNVGPKASQCCYLSSSGASFSEFPDGDLGIRARVTAQVECSGMINEPTILALSDVPGDGGGYVRLTWLRSLFDQTGSSPEIRRYRIWRRRHDPLPPMPLLSSGESPMESGPAPGGSYQMGWDGPAWDLVATVTALDSCTYTLDLPTHCDSTAGDTCWNYFCVSAHTGTPGERYDSGVERAYSMDDLGQLGFSSDRVPAPAGPGADGLAIARRLTAEPNPGQSVFTIEFGLARADWVQLDVYDVSGRRVASLLDEFAAPGRHRVHWDSSVQAERPLSPGLYFARLITATGVNTAKIVIMR